MPSSEYYRRQSELCLQLALLHNDTHTTYWLVELAKEMQARAEAAPALTAHRHSALPAYMMGADKPQGGGGIDHG